MRKVPLILLVALVLVAGCNKVSQTSMPVNLEGIVKSFMEAANNGDIERCLSLVADDIVVRQDPPGTRLEGKNQYEAVMRVTSRWNQKYYDISPYKVDGNKVRFTAKVSSDDSRILGIDYVTSSFEVLVRDGKIISILATPDSSDWAKIVELTRGGIGVRLSFTDKGARVEQMLENSLAYEAGLRVGDLITAVNRHSYSQMREGEIQLRISGKVGSKVLLTVIREGLATPIDIEVTRIDMTQYRK